MARDKTFGRLKGQVSGAAIAVIAVIVIAVVVLFAFPQVLGGFNILGPSSSAPIGVGPGTAGVVITSFLVSPPIVEGDDVATFTMNVQNKGGIDTDSIQYDIFGLGDSNSWSGKLTTQTGATRLEKEDTTRQKPGETTVQEWESTAKKKNVDITYPVTGRADYKYRTEAELVMLLYGRDNPNVKNTGITQSTITQTSVTAGPLAVVPKGTIPLIGRSTKEFTITFEITNVGGGRPYSGSKTIDLDKIRVTAEGCTLTTSGSSDVKLINKQKTISCKVTPNIQSDGQDTKTVKLRIDYNYIVESTVQVKVLKSFEQVS